jgi:uncharacterized membrane protein
MKYDDDDDDDDLLPGISTIHALFCLSKKLTWLIPTLLNFCMVLKNKFLSERKESHYNYTIETYCKKCFF